MKPLIQNEQFVKIAAPLLVGILFLLFWQIAVVAYEMPKYILPGPIEIMKSDHRLENPAQCVVDDTEDHPAGLRHCRGVGRRGIAAVHPEQMD